MTRLLPLLLLFVSTFAVGQSTYETVGIIGNAAPSGWDASTPMMQDSTDVHQWTLFSVLITDGELKFRANDSWDVNWGSADFPVGVGVPDGPNIIATSGVYNISFNDSTGEYIFSGVEDPNSPDPEASVYETVGIIGNATPSGWDASTPMIQDSADAHQWTLSQVTLTDGEAKFRANDTWDVNWGNDTFPTGTGIMDGPNIPATAGVYDIRFDDRTGEYSFDSTDEPNNPDEPNPDAPVYATVGLIGGASPGGWGASVPMNQDPNNPHRWTLNEVTLTLGEAKFRVNDSWDINWGDLSFPVGIGLRDGPNIQAEPGVYDIAFNDITGAYTFTAAGEARLYETVGIIGNATANGWDASTLMNRDTIDLHTWTLNQVNLTNGEAKFRANDTWDVNWGSNSFPNGIGVQDGPNIPVPAGIYDITFNDITGVYSFAGTGEGGPESMAVTLEPEFPGLDEEVTIIYDATQGVSGLIDAEKVYFHSGVIVTDTSGTGWTNVVGNWGRDDGVGEMTRVPGEEYQWQITLPSIREYYDVPNGQPVFRLGMVFRNADGTQTGKSGTNQDIYVAVNPGNYVRWTNPTTDLLFTQSGETIQLQAQASSEASTLEILIDQGDGFVSVASETNATAIAYDYPVTQTKVIRVKVVAALEDETVENVRELQVAVRPDTPVAELPAGVHQGINYDSTDLTQVTLVLLAPQKEFTYVVGDFNNWEIDSAYLMNQTPDGEYFWLTISGLTPQQSYVFQYWVDGTIKIGDPYAHQVADPYNDPGIPESIYPNLPDYDRTSDGIATVLQTGQTAYEWQYPEVVGGRPDKEDLVIYELLLRDFLASHSYDDLADTLSYLKRLGVNAIELLPIMEFEGNESWGYNPSYALAADKYYGTPDDLRAFIDRAHAEGFVVLLDMVLNHHFGQSPMVRMYWDEENQRPAENNPWFNPVATHPFNVGYDFNHESSYTQRYIDDVNRYWLEEFEFDGFRFDLSKGFTQNEGKDPNDVGAWSSYDQSRIDLLKRMADQIWDIDSSTYVILEHLAVNEEEQVLAEYGMMLWGNMNEAYGQSVAGNTESDLSGALASERGLPDESLIAYMESHDEERLMVYALEEGESSGEYDVQDLDTALDRIKLASAFYYTLPGPKMLWQFGELGYDISINFNGRVGNKPIPWGDAYELNYYQDSARQELYRTTAAIINLVDDYSEVFEDGEFSARLYGQMREINISHDEANVTIVGNFGVTERSFAPHFQHTGTWYDALSGEPYEVSNPWQAVLLAPGEFHIYLDQPVDGTSTALAAPVNLEAASPNGGKVTLTWEDEANNETGYVVERSWLNPWWPQQYYAVAELPADTEEYIDTKVIPGLTYSYRVKATNASEASPYSNEVTIQVRLRKEIEDFIEDLLATLKLYPNPTTNGRLTISWEAQEATKIQLRVLDITGQEQDRWTVDNASLSSSLETNVSHLPAGVYILEVVVDNERVIRRFTVSQN